MNTKLLFTQRELLQFLFLVVLLSFPVLLIAQPNSGCNNPVQNGNSNEWSEECYLNNSCQEQGNPCTANDVRLLGIYLADLSGEPLPVCEIGETTSVTLWGTFINGTGTNRYAIRTRTEVWINNAFVIELNSCSFDVLASGETDAALLGSFNYTCGDQIQLRYTWVGWNTSASQCSNPAEQSTYNNVCNEYSPSKCSKQLASIDFLSPNFLYECGEIITGSTEVCFQNLTIGGVQPLTYLWEFGDGATSTQQNPCHTYLATSGIYAVTLTATGANGVDAMAFQVLDLEALDCCDLTITCPANLTVECGSSTLPGETGEANGVSTCNAEVEVVYSDDIVVNPNCTGAMTITRTWTASDDTGLTATCVQTIQVTDTTPPVCATHNIQIDTVLGEEATVITLTPEMIDAGSYDGCSNVVLSITPQTFTCEDEGENIVTLTVTDECGNTSTCTAVVTINCYDPCILPDVQVYLEGALVSPDNHTVFLTEMRTNLNALRILPGQTYSDPFLNTSVYTPAGHPYGGSPWNYTGTEASGYDSFGSAANGTANYPPDAVDWVLLGLRTSPNGLPVCQGAGLLLKNGDIIFPEFDCCTQNPLDSFYVTVEHRNHLIVMSQNRITPDPNTSILSFDFRAQQSYIDDPIFIGFVGQAEVTPGVFAMHAGNGEMDLFLSSDTDINFNDRSKWELDNGFNGFYRTGDYNMNGDSNFNDRTLWEKNNGKFTSVPRD